MAKKHRNWRPQEVPRQPEQVVPNGIGGAKPLPDWCYKYRGNRVQPAEGVWGVQGSASYLPAPEVPEITDKGIFVHYISLNGLPAPLFPSRTYAPVQIIYAMAGPKRLMINAVKFIVSLHKKGRIDRLFFYFNDFCDMMLKPFYLKDEYYCGPAKEVRAFVRTLLMQFWVSEAVADRTGEIAGMLLESDNAYRMRVQDLGGETTKEALLDDFPTEIEALLTLQSQREVVPGGGQEVVQRFRTVSKPLKWMWRIPWTREKLRKAISVVNLDELKMSEGDFYHSILYSDYNAKGMDFNQRLQVYAQYHGPDPAKWPTRVLVRNAGNN